MIVYPPLAEMTDEEKGSWKPGQKKKKSERVDATWNPKSKSRNSFVQIPQLVVAGIFTSGLDLMNIWS